MMRSILLAGLTASTLLMPLSLRAGTAPGAASGVINLGSNTTGQSTATFTTSNTTPVALPPQLTSGGLQNATPELAALAGALTGQTVNGLTPQQSAALIASQLTSAGASPTLTTALSDSLLSFGSNPTVGNLVTAVNAFNALIQGSDAASLPALAGQLGPIRGQLLGIAASVRGQGGGGNPTGN